MSFLFLKLSFRFLPSDFITYFSVSVSLSLSFTHIHVHIHTHIHTLIHAHIHIHKYTHKHTYTKFWQNSESRKMVFTQDDQKSWFYLLLFCFVFCVDFFFFFFLPSPLHEQDVIQGQFFTKFNRFEFRVLLLDLLQYQGWKKTSLAYY